MAANQSLAELQRLQAEYALSPSGSAGALAGNGNVAALTGLTQIGAAGSRRLYSYNIHNPNAAVAFVQMFNAASVGAVTLGTTPPTDWIAIPAGGVIDGFWPISPAFNAGLVVAATTTPTGNTAVGVGLPLSFGFA